MKGINEMDEQNLNQVLSALKALKQAAEEAVAKGQTAGTGTLTVRGYQRIYDQVRAAYPDDLFIETLALEIEDGMTEDAVLNQTLYAATQLDRYLREQNRVSSGGGEFAFSELKNLGRQIQEQVIGISRNTLKRAFANIDVDFEAGEGSHFKDQDLTGRDLSDADMRNSRVKNVNMTNINLQNARFDNARLKNVDLTQAILHEASFKNARLSYISAANADFTGATLVHSRLNDLDASNAVFVRADFTGSRLDSRISAGRISVRAL